MSRIVITLVRLSIGVAILIGLFGAVIVIPVSARDAVDQFPPYEPYATVLATAAVLALLSVLVALVAVIALLSMIARDAIFTDRAFRWVNVIIGCFGFATAIAVAVVVYLVLTPIPTPDDGMEVIGAVLGTGACAALGTTFVLFMLVMRQLLRKAVELHAEMAEVV